MVVDRPIPVWLCASVATLVAKSLLVQPGEVAVELEKQALANDLTECPISAQRLKETYVEMNVWSSNDVGDSKVIETAADARCLTFGIYWRLVHKALHSSDVLFSSPFRQTSPISWLVFILLRMMLVGQRL